ncbi:MAG: biopolymer transporter ExbB [Microgenomates group bacterium]
MEKSKSVAKQQQVSTFSQPIRQIVTMLVALGLVGFGAWMISDVVIGIIKTNLWLNGSIALVFFLGIATCFWQVFILAQSVSWIESYVRRDAGAEEATAPRLLAPLAQLLRSRTAKLQIQSSSAHSILESVATRIDEARDITRYLTNLLIFLGLLGTFYGLATTVPAIVDTIKSLAPQEGETGLDVFGKLMTGLESQLGGMGTAFSSSLLGLAGSLVVGLLELFASHGQNRFYRELEEWLSSITRFGFATAEHDGASDAGTVSVVLDHLTGQIEVLQTLMAQSEANRTASDQGLARLADAIQTLAKRGSPEGELKGELAAGLARLASGQDKIVAGQDRMITALVALSPTTEGGAHSDAESRMRLRSIDVQLLRILEEMSAGRQESVADLRAEISALTASLRQLARSRT